MTWPSTRSSEDALFASGLPFLVSINDVPEAWELGRHHEAVLAQEQLQAQWCLWCARAFSSGSSVSRRISENLHISPSVNIDDGWAAVKKHIEQDLGVNTEKEQAYWEDWDKACCGASSRGIETSKK